MDKRFLFRGSPCELRDRNTYGKWIYGDRCCCKELDETTQIRFWVDRGRYYASVDVDPATVGQCTGLTAAKSYRGDGEQERLVFTGDIAQYAKNIYIVRFGPYNVNPENCAPAYVVGYYLQWVSWNFKDRINKIVPLYCIDGMAAAFPAHVADSKEGIENLYLEIIGNMHDHPELLGGEKGATE